jgi:nitroreductase
MLNTLLAAGCAAPVGMGQYDSLHLTVIQDKKLLKDISAGIAKAVNREGDMLYGAPTVVLVSSRDGAMPGVEYANAACIIENIMIAAADQNLDSVLIWGTALAVNADAELRGALAIPEGFKPVASVAIGYADASETTEKELKITIALNRV